MIEMIRNEKGTTETVVDWPSFKSSLLIEVFRGSEIFTSSAVLIKRNVLLTAAHSVFGIDKGYVHLGSKYSNENIRIAFKKIVIHKQYNKSISNFSNDIAMIVLDHNMPNNFEPVGFSDNFIESGTKVERLGFGARNGISKRTWTNPVIENFQDRHIELIDNSSVVGDSGGPIYFNKKLVAIHSTKEGNRTYAVLVSRYRTWINDHLPIKEVCN